MLNSTLKQLAAELAARRVSSVEVTQYFLKRINTLGKALNAFISVDEEKSLAAGARRRPADCRRRRRAADRHPGRAQGHLLRQGLAHDLRLENAVELRRSLRRARDRAVQCGRRGDRRQDQHGRVRDGFVQRDFVLRPGQESLGHGGGARRQFGRLGGGGGGAPRAGGNRHRHRRLDPPAGGADRHLRAEADLRRGVALRHDRVRLQPRPGRAVREDRGRPRADAERDGGFRRARFDQPATRARGLHARNRRLARSRQAAERVAHRPAARIFRRRRCAGCGASGRRGDRASSRSSAARRSRCGCPT